MMKKLISVGYNVSPNNFPGLWDYWVRYKNGNSDGNDFQHNLMSQHMRSEIILVLKEFDLMFGTTREEWQYEALSWGGLYGTRPWNNFMQTNSALATQYYQYIQEQQEAGGCP